MTVLATPQVLQLAVFPEAGIREKAVAVSPKNKSRKKVLFPAWKADKIRSRLNRFRFAHRSGEKLMPMSAVMQRLGECPTIDAPMRTRGKINFPEEWLRRFDLGTGGLPYDRVDAIRLWLIYEGFLTDEELNETLGDAGEMLALYGYLGRTTPRAQERAGAFAHEHAVTARFEYDTETITLVFSRTTDDLLFEVEELHAHEDKVLTGVGGMRDARREWLRKGYAFYSTRMDLLHIFLRGAAPADRLTYVEVEPYITPKDSPVLFLMRAGLPWRSKDSVFQEPMFRGGILTVESCSVLKFEPTDRRDHDVH